MFYEFNGTIESIDETRTFGKSNFQKRTFVVKENNEQAKYPNLVQFTLKGEKCAELDGVNTGSAVSISFAIDGRSWDKGDGSPIRYFTDLAVIKMTVSGEKQVNVPEPATPVADTADVADDIPF